MILKYLQKTLFFLIPLLLIAACKKDDDATDNTPTCDDSLLPVIMMHGFLGSGDTYANHFMRFTSNGYCADRLFVFDWNSLDANANTTAELDAFIDNVLAQTSATQVNLAGHSAGGGVGYNYLSDPDHAAKVNRYVHIGSSQQSQPAGAEGEVPTLNLYSAADEVVEGGDIPEATNVTLTDADHYEVATNEASFQAIYTFFNDETEPQTTNILPEEKPVISGKVLSLGENTPFSGASVEIYVTDAATGFRINETPDATFTTNGNGEWGPYEAQSGTTYEFYVKSSNPDDRQVHYYREPFVRSNSLVYLRTLPSPSSLAGLALATLPSDDGQSVVAVFSSAKAIVSGRDNLIVNDLTLSTEQYASADQTTIAMFLYEDGDQMTGGGPVGLFGSFPFLNGVDMYFPTIEPATINIKFNGRELNLRNWASASEGVIVAVLD